MSTWESRGLIPGPATPGLWLSGTTRCHFPNLILLNPHLNPHLLYCKAFTSVVPKSPCEFASPHRELLCTSIAEGGQSRQTLDRVVGKALKYIRLQQLSF